MSSLPMPTISSALRETASLSAEELKHFKENFMKDVILNLNKAYDHHEARKTILMRLRILLEGIQAYEPYGVVDNEFTMWTLQTKQAQYDKSITSEKLVSMEKAIHHKLEEIVNRLAMSEYHIALMNNALHTLEDHPKIKPVSDSDSLDDEYEMVEEEVDKAYTSFQELSFAQKDVNVEAIEDYLISLFDTAVGHDELQSFRHQMTEYGEALLSGGDDLDTELVKRCIKDLLDNGLLSVDRQSRLQGYLQSGPAIRELTATLNAKSIGHWNWRNDERGLPVSAQKNAEGKYCITVEEDIIDMLFLHSVAMRWGMELKDALKRLHYTWIGGNPPTPEEVRKREYYLEGFCPPLPPPCTECHPHMPSGCSMYPSMAPPPPPMSPLYKPSNRRKCSSIPPPPTRKYRRNTIALLPPPPPSGPTLSIDQERCTFYMRHLLLSRLPEIEACPLKRRKGVENQDDLLKMLTLDIKTREAFDGSVHGIRANFRSFATSLPHGTILTILEYFGVSQKWLEFFRRFLSAPLHFSPLNRDTPIQVQTRTCGLPIAHGFETLLGEALLFCLDLAVHKGTSAEQTTPYLLRQRDQCYFVGKKQQCQEVREQIETFAKVMSLDVKVEDMFPPASGPVSAIGLVAFNRNGARDWEKSNGVTVSTANARVAAYASHIKMQLAACPTVFAWVSTWNRTIGTYAPELFGPIANAFGKAHLEAVKKAYGIMYEVIFPDSNLTRHVMDMLPPLPSGDPSFSQEAWIHLPAICGGLGVKNPFANVNSVASNMTLDPDAHWKQYLEDEKKYYGRKEEMFSRLTDTEREEKLTVICEGDESRIEAVFGKEWKINTTVFPTLKGLTDDRERVIDLSLFSPPNPFNTCPHNPPRPFEVPPNALGTYTLLANHSIPSVVTVSDRVRNEMYRTVGKLGLNPSDPTNFQDKWALGLYGDECFGRFGGIEIWYRERMPMELLKALRVEEVVEEDVEEDLEEA